MSRELDQLATIVSDAESFLSTFKQRRELIDATRGKHFKENPDDTIKVRGASFESSLRPPPTEEPWQPPQVADATCPTATLSCDSIAASASKCGFSEFVGYESTPPKLYRTKTTHESATVNVHTADYCDAYVGSAEKEVTESYDADCVYHASACTGSGTVTRTVDTSPACGYSESDNCTTTTANPCAYEIPWGPFCGVVFQIGSCTQTTTSNTRTNECPYDFVPTMGGYISHNTYTKTETLSDEFTTAELNSAVDAAMPAYSGAFDCGAAFAPGQGCECQAVYDLSEDETSLTKEKFKPRFDWPTALVAGTVLSYKERFTPSGGGSPTDTVRTWTAAGGETFHVGTEVVATSNGVTTIVNVVTTCP